MKFARHVLEYIAARAILALLALLPLSLATRIAMFVSRALFASLPRLRRIGLRNLELALPNLSLAERRRLLKQSFENFGRIIADFAHFPRTTPTDLAARVETSFPQVLPTSRIFRAQPRPIWPLGLKPLSLKDSKTATAPPRLLDAASSSLRHTLATGSYSPLLVPPRSSLSPTSLALSTILCSIATPRACAAGSATVPLTNAIRFCKVSPSLTLAVTSAFSQT